MMSPERVEAEVRNLLMDGLDAGKIARRLGVPVIRVQAAVHKLNGRDPAAAARETASKRRQDERHLSGAVRPSGGPRYLGPNRARGAKRG